MHLKKFLSNRGTILGFLVTLLFGILVFLIYFTGYQAMPNNLDQLPVTIVNQSKSNHQISHQLKKQLPFKHIHETQDLKHAQDNLAARQTYLIIAIPAHFAQKALQNKQPQLTFYVNQANPTSVNTSLNKVTQKVSSQLIQQLTLQQTTLQLAQPQLTALKQTLKQQQQAAQSKFKQAQQQIAAAPEDQQAKLTAQLQQQVHQQQQQAQKTAKNKVQTILQTAKKQAQKQSLPVIKVKLHTQNPVKQGMNYSMAPFFATIALFLGTMIAALLLYGTYAKFAPQIGRFQAFFHIEVIYLLISFVNGGVISWFMSVMLNLSRLNLGVLWLVHSLFMLTVFNFTSVVYFAIGQIGVTVNILLTMIQVVSGAGMLPVSAMNGFYRTMHYISPMYYNIQADMINFYGGHGLTANIQGQLFLLISLIVLNLIIIIIRKKQPFVDLRKLS